MTFDQAVTILKATLGATVNSLPVTYEAGGDTLPDTPTGKIEVGFRLIDDDRASIGAPGDDRFDEEGALIAYVLVPAAQPGGGDVDAAARQTCDALSALFRGKDLSGVEILRIRGDDGGGTDQNGTWWRRWRRIEFRYQLYA